MPTKKPRYTVVVSPEERGIIEEKRKTAGMGISEFFRTAALKAGVIPDRERTALLLGLSHDLRRVGNLFRMELSNPERFTAAEGHRRRVEKDHEEIMAIAARVETAAAGGRQDGGEFDEDDVRLAAVAMHITQKRNTRARGDKTYHLVVSFREKPDDATLRRVEDEFCSALGFSENERVSVLHGDTDNVHLHIAINKIHPVTHRMVSPFRDHTILARTCRRLEKELAIVADNHEFRAEGRDSQACRMEFFGDMESMAGWIRRELSPALLMASSWEEFHALLAEHGLRCRLSGNGCTFTDGTVHVKASTVNRAFSKGKLEKRFGKFQAAEPATGSAPGYQKKPLRRKTDTSILWQEYQTYREEQKRRRILGLQELDSELKAVIDGMFEPGLTDLAARHLVSDRSLRRIIRMLRAANRRREIAALRKRYRMRKAAIRHDCAVLSWRAWIDSLACVGREDALALIRSRGGVVMPESIGMHGGDAGATAVKVTRKGTRIFRDGMRENLGRWSSGSESSLKAFLRKNISREIVLNGSGAFMDRIFSMLMQCGLSPRFAQPETDAAWRRHRQQPWRQQTSTRNRGRQ